MLGAVQSPWELQLFGRGASKSPGAGTLKPLRSLQKPSLCCMVINGCGCPWGMMNENRETMSPGWRLFPLFSQTPQWLLSTPSLPLFPGTDQGPEAWRGSFHPEATPSLSPSLGGPKPSSPCSHAVPLRPSYSTGYQRVNLTTSLGSTCLSAKTWWGSG